MRGIFSECGRTRAAAGPGPVVDGLSAVRQRVQFSLEGTSFNAVLWVTQGPMCPGSSLPGACLVGDGGSPAIFDAVLDPGDYWVNVAGFNAESRGAYSLSVVPLPGGVSDGGL